jgi:hypothetical protein
MTMVEDGICHRARSVKELIQPIASPESPRGFHRWHVEELLVLLREARHLEVGNGSMLRMPWRTIPPWPGTSAASPRLPTIAAWHLARVRVLQTLLWQLGILMRFSLYTFMSSTIFD